jgi:SAM-dependent methyltransferase
MTTSTSTEFPCQVCGGKDLDLQSGFETLPRVTSDCKPWPAGGTLALCPDCGGIQKLPDAEWLHEVRRIYGSYEIYHLSGGAEQIVFTATDGAASPRSRVLVDFISRTIDLPAKGKLIDIGCGNGAALANFSKLLPQWELYGNELSARALGRLREIPNFVALYDTADLEKVPGRYDLVSMIHSLEHMPSPLTTLTKLARLLDPNGVLFIEVPDIDSSPFDLVVADHLCHFSADTLRHLAARAGLLPTSLTTKVLDKEITFLGRLGSEVALRPDPGAGLRKLRATLSWLHAVLDQGRVLSTKGNFGIFGTSISGMWLYGAVGDAVDFFVDEDPARIGHRYDGKPILSPQEVPADATVYVPLTPTVSAKVVARMAGLAARFVPPPQWPRDESPADRSRSH